MSDRSVRPEPDDIHREIAHDIPPDIHRDVPLDGLGPPADPQPGDEVPVARTSGVPAGAARAGESDPATMPLLEFSGVTKLFRRTVALHGLDLRIDPGVGYALIGRNAAGKTTARIQLLILLAPGFFSGPAFAENVEEFVVALAPPLIGKEPRIRGNLVVWQRHPGEVALREPSVIQCRDMSRGDSLVIDVAAYPANRGGVCLSETHLFWGCDTVPVYARRIEDLRLGLNGPNVLVATHAIVRAASRDYVFLTADWESLGGDCFRGKYLAKAISLLADPSPDAIRLVAHQRCFPAMSRGAAASDSYFVWQDRDPEVPNDSFKIYAKRTEDLFVPGAEDLVIDSGMNGLGSFLALHDSTLVFQAYLPQRSPRTGIYLLDLDRTTDPIPVATTDDPDVSLLYRVSSVCGVGPVRQRSGALGDPGELAEASGGLGDGDLAVGARSGVAEGSGAGGPGGVAV